MIIMEPPSALRLFVVMQGSIVPQIFSKIISVAVLSGTVMLLDMHVVSLPRIPIAAMGVFGIALSLFLGFRNNAAYDRWWETRRLWGAFIGDG
ncbi:bestrophin family ion channel [Roseibium sp. SCPC15]|uniref:bestrophin family ion channel n=1 Tax=Roseibium sp. SCP15 TaxID=3141376 RepID=UPI003334F607